MSRGPAIVTSKIPHRHRKQLISKLQIRQANPSPPIIEELETTVERQIMPVPKTNHRNETMVEERRFEVKQIPNSLCNLANRSNCRDQFPNSLGFKIHPSLLTYLIRLIRLIGIIGRSVGRSLLRVNRVDNKVFQCSPLHIMPTRKVT